VNESKAIGDRKGFIGTLDWIIKSINKVLLAIAGVCLVFVVLMIFIDVAGRTFFHFPIPGTSELVECFTSGIAFMGLGVCTMAMQHIKVEVVVEQLPKKAQKFFDILNYLIVIFITFIIAQQSVVQGFLMKTAGTAGYISKIPVYPFYFAVAFAYLLMTLSTVLLILKLFQRKEAVK
jgi:TRAP-type C4-dicarboxylate transport system permease small subunit